VCPGSLVKVVKYYFCKHFNTSNGYRHCEFSGYEIAYNNLGVVYLEGSGDIKSALEAFSKAIKNNPNYALAYYNKGRAYEAVKNHAEAANYYQMAIDLNVLTNELDGEEIEERLHRLFSA